MVRKKEVLGRDAEVTKANYLPGGGAESHEAKYIIANCVSTEKGAKPEHIPLPQDLPKREAGRARI